MANLKDLTVTGSARIVGNLYAGNLTDSLMPDYANQIIGTDIARNTLVQAQKDSFVVVWVADPYLEDYRVHITDDTSNPTKYVVGYRYDDVNGATQGTSFTFLIPKGWYFTCTAEYAFQYRIYPYKGAN